MMIVLQLFTVYSKKGGITLSLSPVGDTVNFYREEGDPFLHAMWTDAFTPEEGWAFKKINCSVVSNSWLPGA